MYAQNASVPFVHSLQAAYVMSCNHLNSTETKPDVQVTNTEACAEAESCGSTLGVICTLQLCNAAE